MPDLLFLSDEVLLSILGHLPSKDIIQVGQVCKRLELLTRDKSLSKSIDLNRETSLLPADLRNYMNKSVRQTVQHLNLNSLYWFAPKDLRFVTRCTNLRSLSVADTKLNTTDIASILGGLKQLETIAFSCDFYTLKDLNSSFPNIRKLDLVSRKSQHVLESEIRKIFPNVEKLRVFTDHFFHLSGPSGEFDFSPNPPSKDKLQVRSFNSDGSQFINVQETNISTLDPKTTKSYHCYGYIFGENIAEPSLELQETFSKFTQLCDLHLEIGDPKGRELELYRSLLNASRTTLQTLQLQDDTNSSQCTASHKGLMQSILGLERLQGLIILNPVLVEKQFFVDVVQSCQELTSLSIRFANSKFNSFAIKDLSHAVAQSRLRTFSLSGMSWLNRSEVLLDSLAGCRTLKMCCLIERSEAFESKMSIGPIMKLVKDADQLEFVFIAAPAVTQSDAKELNRYMAGLTKSKPFFIGKIVQEVDRRNLDIPDCYKHVVVQKLPFIVGD